MSEPLADRLEAFAKDAASVHGNGARNHILLTLGGCVSRNIGEIVAALRERDARLSPQKE